MHAAELIGLGKDPVPEAYQPETGIHWFWTDETEARGRYVAFRIIPGSEFAGVLTDEIEIYRGKE